MTAWKTKTDTPFAAVNAAGRLLALCATPDAARVLAGVDGAVIERAPIEVRPHDRDRNLCQGLAPHAGYMVARNDVVRAWVFGYEAALDRAGERGHVIRAIDAQRRGCLVDVAAFRRQAGTEAA